MEKGQRLNPGAGFRVISLALRAQAVIIHTTNHFVRPTSSACARQFTTVNARFDVPLFPAAANICGAHEPSAKKITFR
jgi:hypothetical protein